ncbi:unnamed protein product [Mytilus coruscus]|uniref:Uncharacterized protein n=1 Tax=Mytilus coruscus TaxID=42192 RepID=A0A6J8DF66_MYTCO|nr:unnamed protein product [Mytilus coruscus]
MNLHNNKNITSSMMLEDITGTKHLPAFDVFKLSIHFLVEHLLKMLEKQENIVHNDEVQWVLTVPAIWTDKAKKFMRSCAEAAGIPTNNLIVALEPEAASIFCQYLQTEKKDCSEPGFTVTAEGTEYMVVDLGGGTADITVHQKASNCHLKEKHRAMGNDCGGTLIDKRFLKLLEKIVGDTIMKSLKEESPLAYLDLVREFETVKRTLDNEKPKVTMSIPFVALEKLCHKVHKTDLQSLIDTSSYSKEIQLTNDKIRMNLEFFNKLFMPSINDVISLIKEIFRNKTLKDVTHLLLVGGFSDCQLMQKAVRQEFPEKRIIIPGEASLSVLKGAVLFGHRPNYITSRIMRRSYGVKTNLPWNEKKYDRKHYVVMEEEERCDNIFSLIVGKDESVEAGMIVKKSFLHLTNIRIRWTLWCMFLKRRHQNMSMMIGALGYDKSQKTSIKATLKTCFHTSTRHTATKNSVLNDGGYKEIPNDSEREFVAFGFDAEDQWTECLYDGEQEDYYYFERFKMNLHNNKNITGSMMLEDITGTKRLTAFHVFKSSIQYLVNHLLNLLKTRGNIVQHEEVQWVLTVPAIWTDRAKTFMRSCAEAAGIPKQNLILALEPEAASIFCQYLPTEKLKFSETGFAMTTEGTKYMVVDLGGGTSDMTVHEKAANGQLKEKHRAMGNDCGGTSIDKKFVSLFEEIVGKTTMNSLKKESPLAYLDLVREFESVKRTVVETSKKKVTMTIPFVALDKMCQKVREKDLQYLLETSSYSKDIKLVHDKIRINVEFFKELFKPSIDGVTSLVKEIFRNKSLKDVTHLLLVGGFSECQLIQDAVRQEFPQKRVIIPEEAGLSVLKGAVLFGHKPNYIQSRVVPCSYGVKTNVPWHEQKYDRKHYKVMEGEERCDNIFSMIVAKDECVEAGMIVKKSFFTPYKHQDKMDIMVYVSEETTPEYVDDDRCTWLCTPTITFSDTCEERRWVDVEFVLGNTEIDLKAHDRNSGKAISAKFNLI